MLIYKKTENNMEIIYNCKAFRNVHDKEDKYIRSTYFYITYFEIN